MSRAFHRRFLRALIGIYLLGPIAVKIASDPSALEANQITVDTTVAEWTAAHRAHALFEAHREDLDFGYRFLADEVCAAGQPMADRTA